MSTFAPRRAVAMVAIALSLAACGSRQPTVVAAGEPVLLATEPAEPRSDLIAESYQAADQLIAKLSGRLDPAKKLLIVSIVDIDALDRTSTFGRIVAEQIGSRLSQRGVRVDQVKPRADTLVLKEKQGEFLLSRDVRELSQERDVQAVVVGTYAVGESWVYVSVRIVRVADASLLSSYDFAVPLTANIKRLLNIQPALVPVSLE